MSEWDYHLVIVDLYDTPPGKDEDALDYFQVKLKVLGADGWEAVAVIHAKNRDPVLLMKRPAE